MVLYCNVGKLCIYFRVSMHVSIRIVINRQMKANSTINGNVRNRTSGRVSLLDPLFQPLLLLSIADGSSCILTLSFGCSNLTIMVDFFPRLTFIFTKIKYLNAQRLADQREIQDESYVFLR